jgi:hypothetical protein
MQHHKPVERVEAALLRFGDPSGFTRLLIHWVYVHHSW